MKPKKLHNNFVQPHYDLYHKHASKWHGEKHALAYDAFHKGWLEAFKFLALLLDELSKDLETPTYTGISLTGASNDCKNRGWNEGQAAAGKKLRKLLKN